MQVGAEKQKRPVTPTWRLDQLMPEPETLRREILETKRALLTRAAAASGIKPANFQTKVNRPTLDGGRGVWSISTQPLDLSRLRIAACLPTPIAVPGIAS
ncbi:MAG TPA: hypothetical protein PK867_25850 [Pirellulales bacterium]|nr:hypothetical protein [Pirellulales bacterium]